MNGGMPHESLFTRLQAGLRNQWCSINVTSQALKSRCLGSKFLDYVIPCLAPHSREVIEREAKRRQVQASLIEARAAGLSPEALRGAIEAIEKLVESDADRRKGVDARLSTIMGLTSIAATISTGLIVSQAAGTISFPGSWGRAGMSMLGFYLIMQLCIAILWAISGQWRKSLRMDSVTDVVPDPTTSEIDWLRSRLIAKSFQLEASRDATNYKVSAMAVAQIATRNFIVGLAAFCVIGVALAFNRPTPETPLLIALRANAELRTLLQGPAGPKGQTGAQGPRGAAGPAGLDGAAECACEPKSIVDKSGKQTCEKGR